ncbi:hypothetical protein L6164_000759 [Bauhinia variegata]|uniref:Uncharacterized protein n=1 Tax=Bauhinia variegata TaxID=167791 RepID=A0ACB9QDG6_BAUVA|nr:hypothetical protein L6164_000759 [Bauhinia variegata]
MAGDVVKDRQAIATEIVKLCAGLPVLIVTIAKALKNKEVHAWKDALKSLQRFDKEGMHQKVYSAVELSYTSLESEEIKSLFLLIAVQGRPNFSKNDLLIFSVGLGIFKDVETLEDARNRLHTLTGELKDKSLLIEDDKTEVVIHDLVREAIASVATQDQRIFTSELFSELKKWPERNHLRKCKQILFNWCYMPSLPEKLECPELQLLVLDNAGSYQQMPDSFFEETRNLKVLDIGGMDCTPKPPTSLGFLKNLIVLYLFDCKCEDIAMVGELINLQILGFYRSILRELPREIGNLHQLSLLALDDCNNLEVIPCNVISNLTSLEELRVGSFVNWEVEVEGKTNVSLNEVGELKPHLTYIDLYVPDANVWPVDLFFESLVSFKIFIGDVWSWYGNVYNSFYESKTLKLKLKRSIQSERGIKMILKNVDDLSLDELNGVKDVLHIQNNREIESIAASSGSPLFAFPNLEILSLRNLSNLEHICHGSLTQESFCKLRVIRVLECHRLKCLFTSSMSKAFSSLAKIEVSECSLLEMLVLSGGGEFSELYSLTMQRLLTLISFSSSETEQIDEGDNPSSFLQALFNEKVSFPQIGDIDNLRYWLNNTMEPTSYRHSSVSVQVKLNRLMKEATHLLCCRLHFSMRRYHSQIGDIDNLRYWLDNTMEPTIYLHSSASVQLKLNRLMKEATHLLCYRLHFSMRRYRSPNWRHS